MTAATELPTLPFIIPANGSLAPLELRCGGGPRSCCCCCCAGLEQSAQLRSTTTEHPPHQPKPQLRTSHSTAPLLSPHPSPSHGSQSSFGAPSGPAVTTYKRRQAHPDRYVWPMLKNGESEQPIMPLASAQPLL